MARDSRKGTYALTEESKHAIEAPEDKMFVHVQFSGIGVDMAAVDSQGGVHLYTLAGAIGRMQPVHGAPATSNGGRSDVDAVVGMHWLPLHPTEFRVSRKIPCIKATRRALTASEVALLQSGDQE